jgi:hypothetical protein
MINKKIYKNIIAGCNICEHRPHVLPAKIVDGNWALLYEHHIAPRPINELMEFLETIEIKATMLPDKLHQTNDEESDIACPMYIAVLLNDVQRIIVVGDVALYKDMSNYSRTISTSKSVLKIPEPTVSNIALIKDAIKDFKKTSIFKE